MKRLFVFLTCLAIFCSAFAYGAATAPRNSTITVGSGAVSPGASVSVNAVINSYHLNVHKITASADTMNGKGRIDLYSKGTFLAADRLYSRTFTGNFTDPDGAIRTEGFALAYTDKDPAAHSDRLLHVLFTNTSSQTRTYTLILEYEASDTGVLDVRQFGAIGNGIHDDTSAIQQAIDEALTNERTVFFPEGRYVTTSSLMLDMAPLVRQEIWLEGVGSRSTIINRSPAGNPALKILNKAHFHVRKLGFTGRPDIVNEAIFIGGANRSGYGSLEDLDLNPNGIGIHFQDTNTVTVDKVRYHQGGSLVSYVAGASSANLKHAILADGIGSVNEIYIRALFSSGYASTTDGGAGIKWDTSDVSTGMRVIDCDLEGSTEQPKRAIDFRNVFNFSVEDSFVENAEIRILASRHGFLKANDGGNYTFGNGTPAGACFYITILGASGPNLVADENNEQIRVIGGIFDDTGTGNYDNRSLGRETLNVSGDGGILLPDELGPVGIKERGRSIPIGEWINVPYSVANFSATTGNWIVDSSDARTFAYTLVGKMMTVNFTIVESTISGGPTRYLKIKIPGGFVAKHFASTVGSAINNGGAGASMDVAVAAGIDEIFMTRGNMENLGFWQDGTDNNYLNGSITFEIQ